MGFLEDVKLIKLLIVLFPKRYLCCDLFWYPVRYFTANN